MSFQDVLTTVLAGGGSGTVLATGVGAVITRALKRIAAEAVREGVQPLTADVTALKYQLASETGGNSNGLRQKVNDIDSKVDTLAEDMAYIKGSLGQAK